jgi:hypothetical protein
MLIGGGFIGVILEREKISWTTSMSCKVISESGLIVADRYQSINMVKSKAKKSTKAGKTKSKSKK